MLQHYFPIVLFIAVGLVIGVLPLVLGRVLGSHRPDAQKNATYECGFAPLDDVRMRFNVRYYLVAILFILFDLEVVFLFPWALVFKDMGAAGLYPMLLFLAILAIGFIYEWKKGALEWE